MKRQALITGSTGQDGRLLTELLLGDGYTVYAMVRRRATHELGNLEDLAGQADLEIVYGDLSDGGSVTRLVRTCRPHEVYHLGGQSHVGRSFDMAEMTGDVTGLGTLRVLEACRQTDPGIRIYYAASSEMFGNSVDAPQSECTWLDARSPYAAAKIYGLHMARLYRSAYGMFVSCGILFNHESEWRGAEFVTRKVTLAAARIRLGQQKRLRLGNLDARRDWGYAGDYVRGMRLMLDHDEPDDFVLATGESHSVREWVDTAFSWLDLDWRKYVDTDPQFVRPAEVRYLCGDAAKARRVLGWRPSIGFGELVALMVDRDLAACKREDLT